jgi:ATP-dependent exoDNAse (exonuclease V) beta subunit
MVGRCLEEPGVRALLERPEGRCTLWREQAFDYVERGELVSGVFDRVVLHHGEGGGVERVQLIDFKTDAVADAAEAAERLPERHGEQMGVYREALSRLTGVPAEKVETWLIAVAVPAAVKCPH